MTANNFVQSGLQAALVISVATAVSNAMTLDQINDALKVGLAIDARQFLAYLGKRTLGPNKIVSSQKHIVIVGLGSFEDDWNKLVFPVWLADSEYTFNIEFTSAFDPLDPDVGKVHAKILAQAEMDILYKAYYHGVASNENKEEIKNNLFLKALEHIKKLAKIEGNPTPTIAKLSLH